MFRLRIVLSELSLHRCIMTLASGVMHLQSARVGIKSERFKLAFGTRMQGDRLMNDS